MHQYPYHVTAHSVFALRPYDFPPGQNRSVKIKLGDYCKLKNITKQQAKTMIKYKWLTATRFKWSIWVEEICPDEINEYLGIS